jgi:2-succinyl-6-hydroxy-2,4-cyclohexadiene-1-carboxylate synthase
LTCLHGFLGLPSDWDLLPCTADAHKVDWMPVLAGLPGKPLDARLDDLAGALNAALSGGSLLGYSMGGRIALHMLLAEGGEKWRSAVIVSASPGLKNRAERSARFNADGAWARRFRYDPWDAVVSAWNDQAVFATDRATQLIRQEFEFDRKHLALSLLRGSLGRQGDLRSKLVALDIPALWIAGELDTKYAALAQECAALNPKFQCEIVSGAGHRAPWTAPQALCAVIGSFSSHN